MSYISSAGSSPELTILKVHIRHTNLVPEIEVKVQYTPGARDQGAAMLLLRGCNECRFLCGPGARKRVCRARQIIQDPHKGG